MQHCSFCGHERCENELKCPECGKYYSKITEIIAEHEAEEEMQSFHGRYKRVLAAEDRKKALLGELERTWDGLTKQAVFSLFVIFAFVFALVVSVL